jgi:hypothetical protein
VTPRSSRRTEASATSRHRCGSPSSSRSNSGYPLSFNGCSLRISVVCFFWIFSFLFLVSRFSHPVYGVFTQSVHNAYLRRQCSAATVIIHGVFNSTPAYLSRPSLGTSHSTGTITASSLMPAVQSTITASPLSTVTATQLKIKIFTLSNYGLIRPQ